MGTHESQDLLLDELRTDLLKADAAFHRDEKLMTEVYHALTNRRWHRVELDGELSLSWRRAADLVDELRAASGHTPLNLEATGGEGFVSRQVTGILGPLGWRSRPLDTTSNDPAHQVSGGQPDPHAEPEWAVALFRLDPTETIGADEAVADLRAALPDARVDDPDDVGVFEVHLRAPSFDAALHVVWDAMAAAGADGRIVFMEHPEIPEHWKTRPSRPGEAGPR